MKNIGDMLHAEVMAEIEELKDGFSSRDFDRLEGELSRIHAIGN
jgi:hypothetical protein